MASNFWSWRRQPASPPPTNGANALAPDRSVDLEPVELYTAGRMVLGLIAPGGERMSDLLNRQPTLMVHAAQLTPYVSEQPVLTQERPISLIWNEILLAMPPAHQTQPGRRIHRRRRRAQLRVGPFEIIGTAHVPPGAELDPYVLHARTRFVAVTDALVRHTGQPRFERGAEVVLVNTAAMTDIEDMLTVE
jgi:hypothetical protein